MIKNGKFVGQVVYKGKQEAIKTDFIKMTLEIKETEGEYPQSIAVDFMNQGIKYAEKINEGDLVEVEVKFTARKYNDRYYNSLKGWNIKKIEMGAKQESEGEDLPF